MGGRGAAPNKKRPPVGSAVLERWQHNNDDEGRQKEMEPGEIGGGPRENDDGLSGAALLTLSLLLS